jgi:hypothetical protein
MRADCNISVGPDVGAHEEARLNLSVPLRWPRRVRLTRAPEAAALDAFAESFVCVCIQHCTILI